MHVPNYTRSDRAAYCLPYTSLKRLTASMMLSLQACSSSV
jgi:hypothetical protein